MGTKSNIDIDVSACLDWDYSGEYRHMALFDAELPTVLQKV